MMKFAVGPADAPFIVRALTVSDFEILLGVPAEDIMERRLRLTLHTSAGAPWPEEGADRSTAPLSVPATYAIKLANAQTEASEMPRKERDAALEAAIRNPDGSGSIVVGGKVFTLRAATIKEFAAELSESRGNGQLTGLRLLRYTLISVDGKPPIEAPHSLVYAWPFDLPTTMLLLDFQLALMDGGEGNDVRVLVDG